MQNDNGAPRASSAEKQPHNKAWKGTPSKTARTRTSRKAFQQSAGEASQSQQSWKDCKEPMHIGYYPVTQVESEKSDE